MPPLTRAVTVKLFLTRQAAVWSWPGSFLNILFLFTAGLDIDPGCVGICEPYHHCRAESSTQNNVEDAIQGDRKEALELVPAGYLEVNHLILYAINIYIWVYKGYLDPIHVHKEILLFSDWYIFSLVVLLISMYNTRALKLTPGKWTSSRRGALVRIAALRKLPHPELWSGHWWVSSPLQEV